MGIFNLNSPLMRGMSKVINTIYLGILWFICSIPIITIGVSTIAMYEVVLKVLKEEEGNITSCFFKAFRSNFKQGLLVWLIVLLVSVVLLFNIFYYGLIDGARHKVMLIGFAVIFAVALAIFSYLFPVMARTENSIRGHFRIAFILAVRNPMWSLLMVFDFLLALLVTYVFYYAPILFIMGPLGYLQGSIFNYIFDRLLRRGLIREENTEESTGESAA